MLIRLLFRNARSAQSRVIVVNLSTVPKILRQHGLKRGSHILAYSALERACNFMALVGCVTRIHQLTYPRDTAFPGGLEGRFLSRDELRQFGRDPVNDMDDEFLTFSERRGDRCYGVIDGDVLASYGWYTRKPFSINPHVTIHFDDRYHFVYKCLTQPAYRGKRLHGIGMARAIYQLTDDGGAGIVAYVESHNYASLRSGQKMGHEEFGVVLIGALAGTYRTWASPGCAPYGFHAQAR